jgi:hypothetical protein
MRHPDVRSVKKNRLYEVKPLARLLGVHPNTVRSWQREGLEPIDDGRPIYFKGDAVKRFLTERRASRRQPCGPGRLFCLPCRSPRKPAGGMLDYVANSPTSGTLQAICPVCGRMMFRTAQANHLSEAAGPYPVSVTMGQPSL